MADGEDVKGATLALFFTFGVSMQTWAEEGMIDRELALYEKISESAEQIYLFTYGDEEDLEYNERTPDNVTVVPKRGVSNDLLYSFFCPILRRETLRECDVLKTNQMLGSWTTLVAKVLFRTPVIVRTGYVLTIFYDELEKPLWMRWIATALEGVAYGLADGVITSSPRGYDYIEDRYLVRGDHRMIPNYIEADVFKPLPIDPVDGSICYVGRLAEQKNLSSLIRAIGGTSYSLTVVGTGELRADLEQLADQVDADVTFRGRVPNHELPELLNAHEVFVLPSHFEGMPKTLLEAMACGRPVVGTAVKGTEEVITHEENGLLCETDPDSIRDALDRLLTNEDLRDRLGTAARETILSEYSLERIVERETDLYASII